MEEKGNTSTLLQMHKFTMVGMILILTISSLTMFTYADNINPGVYSKYSAPYGIAYKEWITRWWQWHISIPKAEHPWTIAEHPWKDPTGEKCAVGQEGPVWFLNYPPGKVELTCTMPKDKAILFPILSGECDYGLNYEDEHTGLPIEPNDEVVRDCAIKGNEYGYKSATIDGKRLKNLDQYRIESDFFNITIPEDNIYDTSPGTFRAMVDGFFVFLEPLPAGRHDIHFTVLVNNPVEHEYNHAKDITYHLIVKP